MSFAEYIGNVACFIMGLMSPFNPAAFALSTVIAIGFAVHKGAILGYGLCPAVHVGLSILMSTVVGFLWGIVAKALAPGGSAPETGVWKITLAAMAIFLTPFLSYAWAANLTMDISSSCKTMFRDDLKDLIPPYSP